MSRSPRRRSVAWHRWVPVSAPIVLVAAWGRTLPGAVALALGVVLAVTVLASVHHAEVVAARVGEPYGSIVLAVAVTVLEVGMILMAMSGDQPRPTLARDTVFAALMITVNGIVGLALFVNAGRAGVAQFRQRSSGSMLAAVATVATLTLVVPGFTSNAGPTFRPPQLAFISIAALLLYVLFITTQGATHRDFFLPVDSEGQLVDEEQHAQPPTARQARAGLGLLLLSLATVIGLAKLITPALEQATSTLGIPVSFVGVVIALLILAPETTAAVRAASRDRVQTSMNLAYGSAMASIALTIPAMAVATIWLPTPLALALDPIHIALLALTLLVAVLTVVPGRATRLTAGVHLTIVAAYVLLAAVP